MSHCVLPPVFFDCGDLIIPKGEPLALFSFMNLHHYMDITQPFVRWAFGKLFAKDIAARNKNISAERPMDETEVIADIFKRMDEIQERLEHERRQRKKLAEQLIER